MLARIVNDVNADQNLTPVLNVHSEEFANSFKEFLMKEGCMKGGIYVFIYFYYNYSFQ